MRTAIVTGGSRGIGRAIAQAIVRDGGRVIITGRNKIHLDQAIAAFPDPSRAAGVIADVRDRAAVDAAIDEAVKRFGGFDTLVNNAGVGAFADVETMSDADWSKVIDTNLTGV